MHFRPRGEVINPNTEIDTQTQGLQSPQSGNVVSDLPSHGARERRDTQAAPWDVQLISCSMLEPFWAKQKAITPMAEPAGSSRLETWPPPQRGIMSPCCIAKLVNSAQSFSNIQLYLILRMLSEID